MQKSAYLGSDYYDIPDPEVVGFHSMREVLLAMAETFETTHAFAYSSDLRAFWVRDGNNFDTLPIAWMSHVGPRFAHLVVPPPTAVVERRPDGGLFMAATDEAFRATNSAHFAAARHIEASLEPFNAVPWTFESGK